MTEFAVIPYIDYNGRRYSPPYRCFCCGAVISRQQFVFSRTCPVCDTGDCTRLYEYTDGSVAASHHPPFDFSKIPSEPIPPEELVDLLGDWDASVIQTLMKNIGY
jgi:hypothetical protein